MSKYSPLERYLKNAKSSRNDITLSFARVEEIIGDELPASANKYREWWSNETEGSHVQARAWLNVGWKVESVSFSRKEVRFIAK